MINFDVVIIGAGPAGIMAAIFAAKNNKKVLVLEKNEFIGRKILATGNGRCNLTNKNIEVSRYHGANKNFIQTTLNNFDQFQTMEFFDGLGVILKEEDKGRIFPRSNQASTVVDALRHTLETEDVAVKTNTIVKNIKKDDNFILTTEDGELFSAKSIVIATGGKAAFQFGSSGDGLFWAKNFGHTIVPIYASLAPIETNDEWVKDLQGVKVEAEVTSFTNNQKLKTTTGDVLFTHYGLSGPAIMAQAGTISPILEENVVSISLDLFPETDAKNLDLKLSNIINANNKKSIRNSLSGLFPAALSPIILNNANVAGEKKAAEISKSERKAIVETIKNLVLTVKKIRPLKEAQVSRGGVDANEIDPNTLESNIITGLYFAGEVIDVDADSGGFNLQWAWSSGYVAGTNIK